MIIRVAGTGIRSATTLVAIHCNGASVKVCRMINGNHVDAEIDLRPATQSKARSLMVSISMSHGIKRWPK